MHGVAIAADGRRTMVSEVSRTAAGNGAQCGGACHTGFQSLVQKVDEVLPPVVIDAGLVVIATVLITVLVRSIVV
jgi:xanthine/uracil permease